MTDSDNRTYINILVASLEEKKAVLTLLKEQTERQERALLVTPFDEESFDDAVSVKETLLVKLAGLDEGFEDVYGRVSQELRNSAASYKREIEQLQELIREITELGTSLEGLEQSNKSRLQIVLSSGRKKIKDFRISSKTAAAYYKNMSGTHKDEQSYFCDKKK